MTPFLISEKIEKYVVYNLNYIEMMFIIIQKIISGNYVRVLCNSLVTGSETGKVYFSLYLLHIGKTLFFYLSVAA